MKQAHIWLSKSNFYYFIFTAANAKVDYTGVVSENRIIIDEHNLSKWLYYHDVECIEKRPGLREYLQAAGKNVFQW